MLYFFMFVAYLLGVVGWWATIAGLDENGRYNPNLGIPRLVCAITGVFVITGAWGYIVWLLR